MRTPLVVQIATGDFRGGIVADCKPRLRLEAWREIIRRIVAANLRRDLIRIDRVDIDVSAIHGRVRSSSGRSSRGISMKNGSPMGEPHTL